MARADRDCGARSRNEEDTPAGTSITDSAVANSAYLYRVRAVNSAGVSGNSAADIATTVIFTNEALVSGTTIVQVAHLTQLRDAVNAVRRLAGASDFNFTDAVSSTLTIKEGQGHEVISPLCTRFRARLTS